MACYSGMHDKLVLIDQSLLRQRQRELHAYHQQPLTRLPLELLNGLPQISAQEFLRRYQKVVDRLKRDAAEKMDELLGGYASD